MWHRNLKELLLARNAGIDSVCRRCEISKALDEASEHLKLKTAKELGRVLQFVSHVYKHTGFCFGRTTRRASGK